MFNQLIGAVYRSVAIDRCGSRSVRGCPSCPHRAVVGHDWPVEIANGTPESCRSPRYFWSRPLAIDGIGWGTQKELKETQIRPPSELECGMLYGPRMYKSKLNVKGNARRVGNVDTANERVIMLPSSHLD